MFQTNYFLSICKINIIEGTFLQIFNNFKRQRMILKSINEIKLKKLLKKQSPNEFEICFASYSDSMKSLLNTMSVHEKQKLLKFFVPNSSSQNNNEKGSSSLIVSNGSSSQMQKSRSLKKSRQQIFSPHFISQVMNQSSKSYFLENTINLNPLSFEDKESKEQQFTNQQKESLKNAFRYICRLIFKQANKYSEKMSFLESISKSQVREKQEQRHTLKKSRSIPRSSLLSAQSLSLSDLNLSSEAQLISGERYFKHILMKLSPKQKQTLLKYMIWFLKTKYLRYINKCNNQNKGKRKQMKKDLYIRFKNTTMLPYLESLLLEVVEKDMF